MQPQRAEEMQRADLSEHPQSATGGEDSQLSEVWSQVTEAGEEAGEYDTALPLGRAIKSDTNTVDDDEGASRRLHGPGGPGAMVSRAHSSQWASSLGSERRRSRRGGNLT